MTAPRRYCEPCDRWCGSREYECKLCGADTVREDLGPRPRKLTTHERHQAAADAGFDTWADWRGEK